MIRQQIRVFDYQLVRHCQQLSDKRTTARQHENIVVEYTKRHIKDVLIGAPLSSLNRNLCRREARTSLGVR